jgi:hypothetical protein
MPTMEDWLVAIAAIVQAVAAVVIVVLTLRLAATAKSALATADKQAEASAAVIGEMTRDRLLAAVPVLNLTMNALEPANPNADQAETTLILTNTSTTPALNIRTSLSEAWEIGKGQEARLSIGTPVAMVGPGEQVEVPVNLGRFPPGQGPRFLHTDWVLINVEYQGLLGASIHQEWYWEPFEWAGAAEPAPGHGAKLVLYRMSGRSGVSGQNDIGWMRG